MSVIGRYKEWNAVFYTQYHNQVLTVFNVALYLLPILAALQYQTSSDIIIWCIITVIWIYYLRSVIFKKFPDAAPIPFCQRGEVKKRGKSIVIKKDESGMAIEVGNPLMSYQPHVSGDNLPLHVPFKGEGDHAVFSFYNLFCKTLFTDGYIFILVTIFFSFLAGCCWLALAQVGIAICAFTNSIAALVILHVRMSLNNVEPNSRAEGIIGNSVACLKKTLYFFFFFFTLTTCLQGVSLGTSHLSYPPPGKIFQIETGKNQALQNVHIYCMGEFNQGPTVWFEHGWTGSSLDFNRVMTYVSGFTRACSWDRPGYGWSDVGTLPRTSEHSMVEEALAQSAAASYIWGGNGTITPLVLVGHSMAGFHTRIFTDRNPSRVGALVLCDPVNCDTIGYTYDMVYNGEAAAPGLYRTYPAADQIESYLMATGLPRVFSWFYFPLYATIYQLPSSIQRLYFNNILRSQWIDVGDSEWAYWPDDAQRCKETKSLGSLPLTLIVANASLSLNPLETVKVAQLSTNNKVIYALDAGHQFIMNETYTKQIGDAIQSSFTVLKATRQQW